MPLRINFEVQHGSDLDIRFLGSAIAQTLPGPGVEFVGDTVAVELSDGGHAGAFR